MRQQVRNLIHGTVWACLAGGCLLAIGSVQAADGDLAKDLAAIRAVGPKGEGNAAASAAAARVAQADVDQLTTILAAMDGMGPLASNWLRGAAEAVADRAYQISGKLPQDDLEAFLFDTSHSPRGRRVAYEFIVRVNQESPERIMPKLLDDPSLELRRDAVQRILDEAGRALEKNKESNPAAAKLYEEALQHARDLDQVKICTDALATLGKPVDTAKHLGFILSWKLVGPFDNSEKKGYAVAYPPEREVDFSQKYDGKLGEVAWIDYVTTDSYGIVDLTQALDKHKGAIAYAAAEFDLDEARQVDLRLGCINANKVWVNGELITANEVYHSGMEIDQYIGTAQLKPGKNTILVKVCQNEQEENWAQRWQFQLRVTDSLGGAASVVSK